MEENAKEVEQDLRQNIDLLQNQIREVRLVQISPPSNRRFLLARTTNGTTAIHHR